MRPGTRPACVAPLLLAAALLLSACGDDEPATTTETSAAAESTTTGTAGELPGTGPGPADSGSGGKSGGGGGKQPSDEVQVEAAVEALLTGEDSGRVCRKVMTRGLVQTAYGDVQGCLAGRSAEPLARSVRIKALNVGGGAARAEAVPKGGLYSGETLEIEAVAEGGTWRIDGFVADVPVGP